MVLVLGLPRAVFAADRLVFVVCVAKFSHFAQRRSSTYDALEVSETLERIGFEVTIREGICDRLETVFVTTRLTPIWAREPSESFA